MSKKSKLPFTPDNDYMEDQMDKVIGQFGKVLKDLNDDEAKKFLNTLLRSVYAQGYTKFYGDVYAFVDNDSGADIAANPNIKERLIKAARIQNSLYAACPVDVFESLKKIRL